MENQSGVATTLAKPPNMPRSRSHSEQGGSRGFLLDFSTKELKMAQMKLEEHDEAIAAITSSSPCSSSACNSAEFLNSDRDEVRSMATSSISNASTVASLHHDQLHRINLIGKGRFSNVYLASGPSWLSNKKNNDSPSSSPKNEKKQPPSLVAVKSIDSSKIKNAKELNVAAGELANEAKILAGLEHENIVRLKGVCSDSFSGSFGFGRSYFLVFEVLRETLCDRLQKWRRQKAKKESIYRKARGVLGFKLGVQFPLRKSSRDSFLFKRLVLNDTSVTSHSTNMTDAEPEIDERKRRMHRRIRATVLGIAKGLEHLHSKGIVLRDLKPANIGYEDTRGVHYGTRDGSEETESSSSVRLFDFGMAQKVEACDPNLACGSLRYMAPEAMMGKGYSLKVDVYSFGVVLFEICSLCHPFSTANKRKRPSKILRNFPSLRRSQQSPKQGAKKGEDSFVVDFRSRLLAGEVVLAKNIEKSVFCPELRALIEECCSDDPSMRPDFREIRSRLASIFHMDNDMASSQLTQPLSVQSVQSVEESKTEDVILTRLLLQSDEESNGSSGLIEPTANHLLSFNKVTQESPFLSSCE